MVSKGVGLMLDLCNAGMLDPPELGDRQQSAATRLAAHVVVKRRVRLSLKQLKTTMVAP